MRLLFVLILVLLAAPTANAVNLGLGSGPRLLGSPKVTTPLIMGLPRGFQCEALFSTPARSEVPALTRLARAIKRETNRELVGNPRHQLIAGKYEVKFVVGILSARRPEILKAIGQAVSEGKIDHLEVGSIVGPKALKWLIRTINQNPESHRMFISGVVCMRCLVESRRESIMASAMAKQTGETLNPGDGWQQRDQNEFNRSLIRLGVRAAGIEMFKSTRLDNWGDMKFSYDSFDRDHIEWSSYSR